MYIDEKIMETTATRDHLLALKTENRQPETSGNRRLQKFR
jgi:hypothetical protein